MLLLREPGVRQVGAVKGTKLHAPFAPQFVLPIGEKLALVGRREAAVLSAGNFAPQWRVSLTPSGKSCAVCGVNERLLIAADTSGILYRTSIGEGASTAIPQAPPRDMPLKIAVSDTRCALLYATANGFRIETYVDPQRSFSHSRMIHFDRQIEIASLRLSRDGNRLFVATDSELFAIDLVKDGSPEDFRLIRNKKGRGALSFPARWPKECLGLVHSGVSNPILDIFSLKSEEPERHVGTVPVSEIPTAIAKHPIEQQRYFVGYGASGIIAEVNLIGPRAEVVRHYLGPPGVSALCLLDNGTKLLAASAREENLVQFSVL